MDCTPIVLPSNANRPIRAKRKERLVEVEVVRNSDFGLNDTKFMAISHLGNILKPGDIVMGYDLTTANFNDNDLTALNDKQVMNLPDVILVRKLFVKRQKKKRTWHLKTMEGVEDSAPNRKVDSGAAEKEYEHFLEELEQDKSMRSKVNLYRTEDTVTTTDETDMEGEDEMPSVPLDELLDDLTLQEESTMILSTLDAEATLAMNFELEEL